MTENEALESCLFWLDDWAFAHEGGRAVIPNLSEVNSAYRTYDYGRHELDGLGYVCTLCGRMGIIKKPVIDDDTDCWHGAGESVKSDDNFFWEREKELHHQVSLSSNPTDRITDR